MTQFALILILLALGAQTGNAIANVSIESLTTVDSAGGAFQNPSQTSFFAIGRQWVFYVENVPGHCDITDAPLCFVYYATNNGTGWSIYNSTKRIDPFCCGDNIAAPGLSVDTNGTYVFVVADGIGPNLAFHYGKLNLNGTISWKGDANVAEAASPTYLRLNTNNDVFVSYSNDSTFVSWSSAPYTTWSSFPLASTSSNAIAIAQLSKGHVYVAYHPLTPPVGLSFTIYGKKLLQQQRRPLPASSSSETLHIQSAYSTKDNAQTVPIPFRPQLGCLQEQHLGVLQPSSFQTPFRQSSTT